MDTITTENNGFTREVLAQAAAAKRIKAANLAANRLDLRSKAIIAFADTPSSVAECAYSLYKTDNGWQLGIHTADVSEYVCEGSPLDIEARKRRGTVFNSGNYDRVMLPNEISDICNLAQRSDKLAISTILELDNRFRVVNSLCEKSVIRVATVCIYGEIDQLQLASDSSSIMLLREKYAPYKGIIDNMYELAAMFCMERTQRGGLDCTLFQKLYKRDENGKVVDFTRIAEPDSRAMLREIGYFVASAVGKFMVSKGFPCIFNGRGSANSKATDYLAKLTNCTACAKDLARRTACIADKAKGTSYYEFVCDAISDSLPPAVYSTAPIDNSFVRENAVVSFFHPISRYTDLLIQRTVKTIIEAKNPKELNLNRQLQVLEAVCDEANQAEQFIFNSRKEYLQQCALEYIENNKEKELIGFPVAVNPDGSVFVALQCGTSGTVPAQYSAALRDASPEVGNYRLLSNQDGIILAPAE